MKSELENNPVINNQRGNSQISPKSNSSIPPAEGFSNTKRPETRFSVWRLRFVTLAGIALAEIIAMGVVYLHKDWPYYLQTLLDAAVMTTIITPLLYYLSFKPMLMHIQEKERTEKVIQARLRLMQFANHHSVDELLQATLDEIEGLTGSSVGFFHFLDEDQKTLSLQSWSTNTVQKMCNASGKGSHYPVDQAGVWADCVRQRKPVIYNDYPSLEHRKGMPEGHATVVREMSVPILRNNKIVAILGIGNKPQDYNQQDVELVSTIADFAWDVIQHKKAEVALSKSEEKFRTLVDWTFDWELWVDPDGKIVYTSPSCERITGYAWEEFVSNPELLEQIVHPEDRPAYDEHQKILHQPNIGQTSIVYRIIDRQEEEHWIEHICRPLFDKENNYLGRRVSNRDITERKRIEDEIAARNQREKALTEMIHNTQMDIARDLHDTIGQNTSFLRMKLEYMTESQANLNPELLGDLKSMSAVANENYDLVRGMLAMLQVNTSADLFRLFKRYAEQVAERSNFEIKLTNQGEARSLTNLQIRQLFYIFREAIGNIEKHAQASQVTINMVWNESDLSLSLKDNGKGFDIVRTQSYDHHYGLKFMKERVTGLNGTFFIESKPGAGTDIMINIPYQAG